MSIDLSKCKVGTVCKTREGKTLEVTEIFPSLPYPITFSDGRTRTFQGKYFQGARIFLDIVSICKPERRKVAKVEAVPYSVDGFDAEMNIGNFSFSLGTYSSRRCAIRGARRFCALIGFDCEVVK